jgi:AbrB family looped-hinge helix DNA binding protein
VARTAIVARTEECEGQMSTVKVSQNFELVIPEEVRKAMGLVPGETVEVFQYEGRIEIMPVRTIGRLRGFLKGIDTSVDRDADRT